MHPPLRTCPTLPDRDVSSALAAWLTLPRYDVVDIGLPSQQTTPPLFGSSTWHRQSHCVNLHRQRAETLKRGGHERAFLRQDGHLIDLGGLCDPTDGSQTVPLQASRARDINPAGQVVGRAETATRSFGFVWSFLHGLLDLSTLLTEPGWRIVDATHIDPTGRILATGLHGGQCHDLLLTPRPVQVPASPLTTDHGTAANTAGWRGQRDAARL